MDSLPEPIFSIVLDYIALTMDGLRAACVCKQWKEFMYKRDKQRLLFAVSCLLKAARGLNGQLSVYEGTMDDKYSLCHENPIFDVEFKCKDTYELSIFSGSGVFVPPGKYCIRNGITLLNKNQRYLNFMHKIGSGVSPRGSSMKRTCEYEKTVEIITDLMEIGFLSLELSYHHLSAIPVFDFPSIFTLESIPSGFDSKYLTHTSRLCYYTTRDDIKNLERSKLSGLATLHQIGVTFKDVPKSKCIII